MTKGTTARTTAHATGSGAYGLGFIGAAVYFIQNASSFWDGVVGVLMALVWPAFLVYELFKLVNL